MNARLGLRLTENVPDEYCDLLWKAVDSIVDAYEGHLTKDRVLAVLLHERISNSNNWISNAISEVCYGLDDVIYPIAIKMIDGHLFKGAFEVIDKIVKQEERQAEGFLYLDVKQEETQKEDVDRRALLNRTLISLERTLEFEGGGVHIACENISPEKTPVTGIIIEIGTKFGGLGDIIKAQEIFGKVARRLEADDNLYFRLRRYADLGKAKAKLGMEPVEFNLASRDLQTLSEKNPENDNREDLVYIAVRKKETGLNPQEELGLALIQTRGYYQRHKDTPYSEDAIIARYCSVAIGTQKCGLDAHDVFQEIIDIVEEDPHSLMRIAHAQVKAGLPSEALLTYKSVTTPVKEGYRYRMVENCLALQLMNCAVALAENGLRDEALDAIKNASDLHKNYGGEGAGYDCTKARNQLKHLGL